MRKPAFPLFMKLALIGIFLAPSIAHAALFSATWVAGSAGGTSATGTMGAINLNLATVSSGNSTQIFPGTWQQILPPSLGTLYPDAAISIGYNCNGNPQNQSVTFSTQVTNPYLLFNYVDGGSVYDFSSIAGTVTLVGNTVGATLSNKTITLPAGSFNQSNNGFAIQLTGTYPSISYTITNGSCGSGHDSAGFDVAETGFSITPT
ncbi:MAG: hypothetical protein EBT06_14355, partial [Gammaproteobacteria bacterium]|nr:hypothetical protein [Gammaproteobacteria bacterium]